MTPIRYRAESAGESADPRPGDAARNRAAVLAAMSRAIRDAETLMRAAGRWEDAGDVLTARGLEADARAALHRYPTILAEVYR